MADKITSNQFLGSTAHWTASARAKESERPDHLFYLPDFPHTWYVTAQKIK